VTWGASWAALGWLTASIIGVVDPRSIDPGESAGVMGALTGAVGFVSGLGFSLILSLRERRKSLRDLSLPRVALWGALGAAALPLLTSMPNLLALLTAPLGATFAIGSIAAARRAALQERAPRDLLPPGHPSVAGPT